MTNRKFYKTIIQITVLSEEPMTGGESLSDICYEMDQGDFSGQMKIGKSKELDGKQMARALKRQGSDPGFFGLDDDGSHEDDEDENQDHNNYAPESQMTE